MGPGSKTGVQITVWFNHSHRPRRNLGVVWEL